MENTSKQTIFPRRIIHLVDSLADINMGIWMPIVNQIIAFRQMGIEAIIVSYPYMNGNEFETHRIQHQIQVKLFKKPSLKQIKDSIFLNKENDLVISHGCWRFPSRIGAQMFKLGYKRIAVPHAMLMPWCLREKALKKKIYFSLFEQKYLKASSCLQAVSLEEKKVLEGFFPATKVKVLANFIAYNESNVEESKNKEQVVFIFLGRLHSVKNILALVAAWTASSLNNDNSFELRLIGKDEGELDKIRALSSKSTNVKILGALYGEAKIKALNEGMFFVLPSLSEGLPTALLEAMSFGLIPICTVACNLPQLFEEEIGFEISNDAVSIIKTLEICKKTKLEARNKRRNKAQRFVLHTFGSTKLNQDYLSLFNEL